MIGKKTECAQLSRWIGCIGAGALACAAHGGGLTFEIAQTASNVGRDARRCAVGFFNNDAHMDIAVALHAPGNGGDGQITILLNDGAGNFAAGTPIHCGRAGGGILAAHLNGDAFIDLVATQAVFTAGGSDSRCGAFVGSPVFFGNGDGTFTHATCLVAGLSPMSAGAGLLNADGIMDVAVASRAGHGLSIFAGLGFGAFGAAVHVASADALSASDLAIADFNGGAPDIALAHANGVNMFAGAGNGMFFDAGPVVAGQSYWRVVASDFDGDTNIDLAASAEGAAEVKVWRGTGSGTFFAPTTLVLAGAASDLLASDMDGDMNVDLIAASEGAQVISIFVNDGMGGFPAREDLVAAGKWRGAAAGDWDSDSAADLAAADDPDDDTSNTVVLKQMTPGGECEGDVDGSGAVNVNDISYVVFRLGLSGPPGTVDGDADGNGTVNVNDISYVVFRLGTCS